MKLDKAIIKRINEFIDDDKDLNPTTLAIKSNLTPSTLFDILNGRTKKVEAFTLKKICFGLGITLEQFYSKEYFNDFDDCID